MDHHLKDQLGHQGGALAHVVGLLHAMHAGEACGGAEEVGLRALSAAAAGWPCLCTACGLTTCCQAPPNMGMGARICISGQRAAKLAALKEGSHKGEAGRGCHDLSIASGMGGHPVLYWVGR